MSAERATASRVERNLRSIESLYVVRVQDHIDARIAGHDGWAYVSPPASRDSALALIGLLLGSDPPNVNGAAVWTRAVPGGRRAITIAPTPDGTRRATAGDVARRLVPDRSAGGG
jgi:hypothetical protein